MRIDLLMEALPIMGIGYAGTFFVIAALIVLVSLLARISGRKGP